MMDLMGVPVLVDDQVEDGEVWITIERGVSVDLNQEVVMADWGDGAWRLWRRLV